jgi:hypothetical protein
VSIKKTEALGESGASNNKKIVVAFVTSEEPRFMTVFFVVSGSAEYVFVSGAFDLNKPLRCIRRPLLETN